MNYLDDGVRGSLQKKTRGVVGTEYGVILSGGQWGSKTGETDTPG